GPIICDGLPFAPPARAALDIARTATDPARLRKILALVTQHGLCTAEELHHELDAGNQRGSSAVRSALGHFDAAVATLLHGRAHRLLRHVPIPAPRWNVTVYDRRRRPIGYADAWWDEIGMAWQLDTEQPPTPTGPGSHIALTAAGVIVVRTPAAALNDAANSTVGRARLIRELTSAFLAGARRPRPPLLFGDPSMLSSA
ncbi:MAG: hypothetical protein ACRDSE_09505, partial [Pseudonocardiaceae bacterium]